jgi:cytochrome c2
MESLSFDETKRAARFDSSQREWNMRRLATHSTFAATVPLALAIKAAHVNEAGEASFGKSQSCHAAGAGPNNKLSLQLNGLVGPNPFETIAAGTPGQDLAAYADEAS